MTTTEDYSLQAFARGLAGDIRTHGLYRGNGHHWMVSRPEGPCCAVYSPTWSSFCRAGGDFGTQIGQAMGGLKRRLGITSVVTWMNESTDEQVLAALDEIAAS